jgi:hypothetical protein
MQILTAFDQDDVGINVICTLTFTNFDPTGGVATLIVSHPGNDDPPRAMTLTFVSLGVWTATYVTVAGDFKPGSYVAEVRVTKGGVSVGSEEFLIVVNT